MRIFTASLISLFLGSLISSWAQSQPNFIIIFTDDQGYADVGVYGSGSAPAGATWNAWDRIPIRTPHLDKMAEEGVRFTNFYSGHPVCTPSRAALLTGVYPHRVGLGSGVFWPDDETGLNQNEVTVAELLKARGYATGMFGKWHLGHKKPFLPTSQGFDEYYGIPFSNDMYTDPHAPLAADAIFRDGWTREKFLALKSLTYDQIKSQHRNLMPMMRNEEIVEFPVDQSTITRRYTEAAISFIRKNKAKPFMVYLPHNMPHTPLYASAQFKGKSPRGLYGDVIEEMDWNVGRLLDSLKALGLDDKTMVIFTSDNGPWLIRQEDGGTAFPFREGKMTNWEGGMRVPMIVRWPEKIPQGLVQSEMAAAIDIYPTLAGLSGGGLPRNRALDGKDIWPLIKGEAGAKSPHQAFYYNLQAVRSGKWKLRDGKLYDLENDVHEDKDVSAANAAKAAELKKLLADFNQDVNADIRPVGTLSTKVLKMGCTDPQALNYLSDAELDDGSCRNTVALSQRQQVGGIRVLHRSGSPLEIQSVTALDVRIVDIHGKIRGSVKGVRKASFSLGNGTYFVHATSEEHNAIFKVAIY